MTIRHFHLQIASFLIGAASISANDRQTADSERTPQETFAAYCAALGDEKWKEAYAMMTPGYRDFQAYELAFGLAMFDEGEGLVKKHQDPEKLKRMQAKAKQQHEEARARAEQGKQLDDKERHAQQVERQREFLASLKDQEKFYCAAMAATVDRLRDDLPDGKLRSVEIKGGRARGTTTRHLESIEAKDGKEIKHRNAYQSPVYFKKDGEGWLIDVPTGEEMSRDNRRISLGLDRGTGEE